MTTPDLVADGSIALRTLTRPSASVSALAARPRAAVALALATAAALLSAAVVIPRTDYGRGESPPAEANGEPAPEPTEYERELTATTARKLGELGDWAGAALLPTLLAVGAAGALSLGFRVAGARASFRPALAVTAHGMLPIWISRLLAVPAALAHAPVARGAVSSLLPSSLAALLPAGGPPALASALGAIDLFALWAVWLVALGMARITGASRARAAATTGLLYLAYVAVFKVALPSLSAGAAAP